LDTGKFENSRTSFIGKNKMCCNSEKAAALQRIKRQSTILPPEYFHTLFIIPTVFGFVNTFRHEI